MASLNLELLISEFHWPWNWTGRNTSSASDEAITSICGRLCLSVSALMFWVSGVFQGSLRRSGGGLMVHHRSLCTCYGCVYCMCLPRHGLVVAILTDVSTFHDRSLVSEMVEDPSSYHGTTAVNLCLHGWLGLLGFCCLFFYNFSYQQCFSIGDERNWKKKKTS